MVFIVHTPCYNRLLSFITLRPGISEISPNTTGHTFGLEWDYDNPSSEKKKKLSPQFYLVSSIYVLLYL